MGTKLCQNLHNDKQPDEPLCSDEFEDAAVVDGEMKRKKLLSATGTGLQY
jgi:hypothetical protein